jgi:hypothetical protein
VSPAPPAVPLCGTADAPGSLKTRAAGIVNGLIIILYIQIIQLIALEANNQQKLLMLSPMAGIG